MFIPEYTIGFYLWIGIFELNPTFPGNESLTGGGILLPLLLNKIERFASLFGFKSIYRVLTGSLSSLPSCDGEDDKDGSEENKYE